MPFNEVLGSLRNTDILLNISHILTFQPFDIIATDYKNAHSSACEFVLSTKMSKIFFINVWRKIVFDICFTEFGTALTTILPILFLYFINTVIVTAGIFEP